MLVFEERGKPEYAENNLSKQGENQQQSQPTYGVEAGIWTQATLVGGERSHYCTIACSPKAVINVQMVLRMFIFLLFFITNLSFLLDTV